MDFDEIMSEEQLAAYGDLKAEMDALDAQRRKLRKKQEQFWNDAFLRTLQKGAWKAVQAGYGDYVLKPTDAETESQLTQLAMQAVALNWHDSFFLAHEHLYLNCHVDDGDILISMSASDAASVDACAKMLSVQFDPTPWMLKLLQEEEARLVSEQARAFENLEKCRASIVETSKRVG